MIFSPPEKQVATFRFELSQLYGYLARIGRVYVWVVEPQLDFFSLGPKHLCASLFCLAEEVVALPHEKLVNPNAGSADVGPLRLVDEPLPDGRIRTGVGDLYDVHEFTRGDRGYAQV